MGDNKNKKKKKIKKSNRSHFDNKYY